MCDRPVVVTPMGEFMEQSATRPGASRPGRLGILRLLAVIALGAVLCTGTVIAAPLSAAAADYPSWDDVERARANVASKESEIRRIEALLERLNANVVATQAEAERAGLEFLEADQAANEAAYKADELQRQADEAHGTAEASRRQAGQLAAQLARAGGSDISANLFVNPGQAESLLERLGYASKIAEQAEGLYERAQQDLNTAQALTDQANVAKEIRNRLREEAQAKQIEAQEKAEAAAAALAEQESHQVELEAQLSALREVSAKTLAEHKAGVEEERRRKAEEERRRREAERLAWEKAQREAQQNGGGGGGGGSTAPVSSGWARPSSAWVNSSYGMRFHPIWKQWRLHAGADFAAGCGTPIFAAGSGTVSYSGAYGGYGNYVKVNHGGGIESAYAHIAPGGIRVSYGSFVTAGQVIAVVGSTGDSTGCHLHFEIRQNGYTTDPVSFLRARGVGI